jgi:hypothetical protein
MLECPSCSCAILTGTRRSLSRTSGCGVLVHVDTEHAPEQFVNRRLAYVALSRGRFDAQIFTDDKGRLIEALSRDVSQHVALDAGHSQNAPSKHIEHAQALMRGFGLGL